MLLSISSFWPLKCPVSCCVGVLCQEGCFGFRCQWRQLLRPVHMPQCPVTFSRALLLNKGYSKSFSRPLCLGEWFWTCVLLPPSGHVRVLSTTPSTPPWSVGGCVDSKGWVLWALPYCLIDKVVGNPSFRSIIFI